MKIFGDDGGKQDNTVVSADAKGNLSMSPPDLSSAEGIANSALTAMKLLMDGMSEALGSGGVPDVGQDQMLGGLNALAMAVQSQATAIRNPNTLAAMRNESPELRRNEESFQAQKMKDMGIGKNAAERAKIQKTINQIYKNPNFISNLIRRSGEAAARCAKEIRDLQERQENLKKK